MAKRGFPKPIKYQPMHPEKYVGDPNDIVIRSSWELKLARYCDRNSHILKWNSEGVVVPYFSRADQKMRKYYIDFVLRVRTKEGFETLLVEVKPEKQTQPPKSGRGRKKETVLNETYTYMVNQDKWEAAREFAKKHGMRFVIMTENELGIK